MKKKSIIFLLIFFCAIMTVFAAVHHTVPIDSNAYRIVEAAEGRGIIRIQSAAKPYTLSYMIKLLNQIKASDAVSEAEKDTIDFLLRDFERQYGTTEYKTAKEIFSNGYFRTSNVEKGNSLSIGLQASSLFTPAMTTSGEKYFDTRNNITAKINGDLFNAVSFDVNFGVLLDKLDPRVGNLNDFRIDCEGFYLRPWEGGTVLDSVPGALYLGVAMTPEIDVSLFDNILDLRWASVRRDWGPGLNNLALSSSASAVDGLEMRLHPFKWFEYNVMAGSTGKFSLSSNIPGLVWPSDKLHENKYDNNFSIHRVEITPAKFVQIGLYESVIYKKRFELAYLSPVSIYMFAQNSVSDYDNMLAGMDLTFAIPKFGKIYVGFSMDEMNNPNPAKWFSLARNIMGLQGGIKITPKMLSFSEFTLQATYLPAFFGTHYDFYGLTVNEDGTYYNQNPWGTGSFCTAYVNKGRSLSYPLNPDSLELLLDFKTDAGKGWEINAGIKDQLSSAQYATSSCGGNTILVPMEYDSVVYNSETGEYEHKGYSDRAFFSNLWKNTITINAGFSKKLASFPVKFLANLTWLLDWQRDYSVSKSSSQVYRPVSATSSDGKDTTVYVPIEINDGTQTTYGSWDWKHPNLTFALSLGVSVYY